MSKDKTVVRVVRRDNPFVQIDKTPINDTRLSWKAKGLLVYLLSKPDDWTILVIDLIKHAKDGRDAVYSGLRELENAGYLTRERKRDENGKFEKGIEYKVYEIPMHTESVEDKPETENPYLATRNGKSVSGKSVSGKSVSGKSDTTNNKRTTNTNSSNNENNNRVEEVVVFDKIKVFFSERNIPVTDKVIRSWLKIADEETIIQAASVAISKKKNIETVVGYINGMLKNGYRPSNQISQAAKEAAVTAEEHQNHPAYAIIASIVKSDLPKSVRWQQAVGAVQNSLEVSWQEAKAIIDELNLF